MALTKISTDGVKDDAITKAKIPADQIEASELADNAVDTNAIQANAVTNAKIGDTEITGNKLADQAVSLDKLPHGTSSNDGKFLRANNGADPSFETVSTTPADGSITQAKLNFPVANRNLIINGAMQVAQRGTSSASSGYQTCDRWQFGGSWQGSAITQSQADVGYNSAPYDKGFRKSYKLTNSNQGSVGAGDNIEITYGFEGQDIATSGWDYVNSSAKITLSFWIKVSVAQTFYGYFRTFEGTSTKYSFPIVCSTTDWEYKTVSVGGEGNFAANVSNAFRMDSSRDLILRIVPFYGTTYTDSGALNNAWQNYSSSNITPDFASSWYLTNGATFEITGVQLEVGSVATDFEHRSFAQELLLCQRYYQEVGMSIQMAGGSSGSSAIGNVNVPIACAMRSAPTVASGITYHMWHGNNDGKNNNGTAMTVASYGTSIPQHSTALRGNVTGFSGVTDNRSGSVCANSGTVIKLSAEL